MGIGNFVELKNSHIGKEVKANHLSYIGDAKIGNKVNIGAGVITCNYNGITKHKTIVGDEVLIGSGSQLIAPLSIESQATIGAGTTLTKNVGKKELVTSRSKQKKIL